MTMIPNRQGFFLLDPGPRVARLRPVARASRPEPTHKKSPFPGQTSRIVP